MASSRKEEERNEKIIRGLMKLPPNRRCINCNSLGPQYVCPNFWTFVCITCSGIHREFTHRVKSVSMSKFASQEVDALQNGGNQRARDIYLKDWDLQRQRLPDSSNVDKIREFIKSVYVDRKYAGGRTSEKPPRDLQNNRYREDETRRASSYHSYSQSPPYDNQYEDRRYGKQAAVLTRKPGSDRGRYEGKMSSFVYSAGRLSEQMFEDRFANDGSGSRVSDYSVSSGGDASRSGVQSPNFQKDIGSSSPSFQPSWDNINEVTQQEKSTRLEENANRGAEGITFPQRTLSSGSFGSMDSYSLSLKSDVDSVSGQIAGTLLDKSTSLSSLFGTSDSLDLFKAPVKPEASSSLSIDSSHLTVHDPPQAFTPLELFADFPQHPSTTKQVQQCIPKNEGWATFDSPQPPVTISVVENENIIPGNVASDEGGSVGSFDLFSSSNTAMQWPSVPFSGSPKASSNISNPWSDSLHDFTAPNNSTSTQPWNAFEDTIGHFPLEETKKVNEQVASDNLLSTGDLYLGVGISENTGEDWTQGAPHGDFRDPLPSHVLGRSFTPQDLPQMGEMKSHAADHKSNNPFDIPYDTDLEQTNSCLDMSSLRHSLPNAELEASFLGGVSQSWFPQNAINVIPYIPAVADGGLAYMAGQAQSSQLPNVSTQGPVASIGRNPFA